MSVYDGMEPMANCSYSLYMAGMLTIGLIVFMLLRKLALAACVTMCSSQPKGHYQVGNMAFSMIDAILLPALSVYGIICITSPEAEICKNYNKQRSNMYHWWLFVALVTVVCGLFLSMMNICLCCIFISWTC